MGGVSKLTVLTVTGLEGHVGLYPEGPCGARGQGEIRGRGVSVSEGGTRKVWEECGGEDRDRLARYYTEVMQRGQA